MSALPTVRVVNPNAPESFMLINEADLCDGHELWNDGVSDDAMTSAFGPSNAERHMDLRVSKGPRGRWYVKLGKEIVEGPFETETEADAVLLDRSNR